MKQLVLLKATALFLTIILPFGLYGQSNRLKILSSQDLDYQPKWYSAYYTSNDRVSLQSKSFRSTDNGKSWKNNPFLFSKAKYNSKNSRRTHITSLYLFKYDKIIHFINAIDLTNIGLKKTKELKEGVSNYYLRYYLSSRSSQNYLVDEVVKDQSGDDETPFSGIVRGVNAYYLGDIGCQPIEMKSGKILLPVQQTIVKKNKLYNPSGTTSFSGARVLIGTVVSDNKVTWQASNLLEISPEKSTRGLLEPTIIELSSGKLLMIMRGSNGGVSDKLFSIPGYKWFSVSNDGGFNWSSPQALKYDNGNALYSPSSMSRLFKRSNGIVYWIGNITDKNPKGNSPRNVLVIGEINEENYRLKKQSVIVLDSQSNNVDLSHVSVIEDRSNKNIIISYPSSGKKWKIIRLN